MCLDIWAEDFDFYRLRSFKGEMNEYRITKYNSVNRVDGVYMYIGTVLPVEKVTEIVTQLGLYCEQYPSPYLINSAVF